MTKSDKFEDVTKVEPKDLDHSDREAVTESSAVRATANESATELIKVNTLVTDENMVHPSMLRINDEHRRADSDRKETTLGRGAQLDPSQNSHDGTSPGILLPSGETDVSQKSSKPTDKNEPIVRPVSQEGAPQEVTAPVVLDPSEMNAQPEPTRTFASVENGKAYDAERGRARADSLLNRIGVRAEEGSEDDKTGEISVEKQSDTKKIQPPKVTLSGLKTSSRNNTLWIWAAIFVFMAVVLVVLATILFARTN